MPDVLHDAVTAAVRDRCGESHVVTDYLVVAASIDMSEGPGRVEYTTVSEGAPHSVAGLIDYAVLGGDDDD